MAQEETVNPAEELKKAEQEAREGELDSPEDVKEQTTSKEQDKPTTCEKECSCQEKAQTCRDAELQAAKDKAAESYELYIRAVAEMENTRRRCAQDVVKARLFGIENFAKNLIPVIDSLEKALESSSSADEATRKGLEVTMRQLDHALEVSGMKAIFPEKEKFNPATSQAIATVPADAEHPAGTVVVVFQRGWTLNDRVLRAAMVSVAG